MEAASHALLRVASRRMLTALRFDLLRAGVQAVGGQLHGRRPKSVGPAEGPPPLQVPAVDPGDSIPGG